MTKFLGETGLKRLASKTKALVDGLRGVSYTNDHGEVGASTDWNEMTAIGSYKVQMGSWGDASKMHSPNSLSSGLYSFGILMVVRSSASDSEHRVLQVYFPHNNDTNQWCARWYNGADSPETAASGWSAWEWVSTDHTYSALKNPTSLTLQANGSTQQVYDGSAAKTFNVTASNVGALPTSTKYAASGSVGGDASKAVGLSQYYSGKGGQQPPSFARGYGARALMTNVPTNGDQNFKNWVYMDPYGADDVGGATAIGVDRMNGRAFVMQSDAKRTAWNNVHELYSTGHRPAFHELDGFAADSGAWGNQTGTKVDYATDATGGSIGFRRDNPSSGKLSVAVDGTLYVNEGATDVRTAVTGISRSGTTFTATRMDGTTFTFTQQDSNTTYTHSAEDSADFNSLTQPGFWRINGGTLKNSPSSSMSYGQLLVVYGAGDTVSQIAMPYSSTAMYVRSGNVVGNSSGTWTAWKTVAFADGVGTSDSAISTARVDEICRSAGLTS